DVARAGGRAGRLVGQRDVTVAGVGEDGGTAGRPVVPPVHDVSLGHAGEAKGEGGSTQGLCEKFHPCGSFPFGVGYEKGYGPSEGLSHGQGWIRGGTLIKNRAPCQVSNSSWTP